MRLANSSLFKDLYGFCFVCVLCFLPLPSPSLWICLTALGPVHAGNLYRVNSYSPLRESTVCCFRNTLLQSWLLPSGRANSSNPRHLFRNLIASVLGPGAVLLLTYILCKTFHMRHLFKLLPVLQVNLALASPNPLWGKSRPVCPVTH